MRLYLTDAIILKKAPYAEADVLVTALTKNFGKIRAVAQGARKQEAKLKGHLEPMTRSRIGFIIGKNFYRLTGAEMADHFPGIRQEPQKLAQASYIIELIDRNVFEEEGDPRIFELVRETFEKLSDPGGLSDGVAGEEETLVHDFHVRLLDVLGLLPDSPLHVQLVDSLVREHLGFKYEPYSGIMEMA